MRRKLLLSPLIIVILIIIAGIGIAGAAILVGGGGDSTGVNLQNGLVGLWKFNGDAKDSTPNANNGTVNGATLSTDRKGEVNKAYSFDGVTNYIDFGNGSTLSSGSVTVSLWMFLASDIDCDGNNNWRSILHKGSTAGTATGYDIVLEEGRSVAWDTGSSGGDRWWPPGIVIPVGSWTHLVLTYDAASGLKQAYQDGQFKSNKSVTAAAITANGSNLLLNNSSVACPAGAGNFSGRVDELRIYNRALSATEVAALYNEYDPGTQMSDLQKGLVGHWDFNGNAKDLTPNSDDGTVYGAIFTTDRKGEANRAYSFDGLGTNYISMGTNSVLDMGTNDFTVSVWAKAISGQTGRGILNKGGWGSIGYSIQEAYSPANTYYFVVKDGTSYKDVSFAGETWGWSHIVGIKTNNHIEVWVNGVKGNTWDGTIGSLSNPSQPFEVGRSFNPYYFNGYVDDVRLYNRALSPTEVVALYDSYDPGISVSNLQKGLVGWWKMDGNAKDNTPYSNDGTNFGAILTTDRKGQANRAYSFDGNTAYIGANGPIITTANPFTVAGWVKLSTFASTDRGNIIIGNYNGSYRGYYLNVSTAGYPNFEVGRLSDTSVAGATSPDALGLNTWYHLVGVYDGNGPKIYVNGVLKNSANYSPVEPEISSTNTRIGGGQWSPPRAQVTGSIDDVRIWNRALTPTEITALYESY